MRPIPYPIDAVHIDEAFTDEGPRALYRAVIEEIAGRDLAGLAREVQDAIDATGVGFGPDSGFHVDAVPRLVGSEEWSALEMALEQRARALNAFIVDVYSDQLIFEAGVMPRQVLDSASDFEPRMRGLVSSAAPPAMLAGMDLVRGSDGELRVLEDNLRMPSGITYALAARDAIGTAVDNGPQPRALEGFLASMREAILAASPRDGGDPSAAILTDGPRNSAWYEHRTLGRALDLPVVTPADLELSGGSLIARIDEARVPIDVIYRRLDEERLTGDDGAPTPLGDLLLPAFEAGTLRSVNSFGNGIADDKLAHAYVEEMIGYYLGEEPLIRSVASMDVSDPAQLEAVLGRLSDFVIKPREGFGGHGVVICGRTGAEELSDVIESVMARPEGFIAQELVPLSTHPTIIGSALEPRHVDLRPFIATWAGGQAVLPGGLTRFARDAGEMIVNSSRGGGGKDTWVVEQ